MGDILIGKTSPPRFMEEYKEFETSGPYRRDTSVGVRPSEHGVVDTVVMTQSNEGGKMYKIRVRDMRVSSIVIVCDMFSFSSIANSGVVCTPADIIPPYSNSTCVEFSPVPRKILESIVTLENQNFTIHYKISDSEHFKLE